MQAKHTVYACIKMKSKKIHVLQHLINGSNWLEWNPKHALTDSHCCGFLGNLTDKNSFSYIIIKCFFLLCTVWHAFMAV